MVIDIATNFALKWSKIKLRTIIAFQIQNFDANVGSARAVEILLENGANPNTYNNGGVNMTALQAAFSHSKLISKNSTQSNELIGCQIQF